MQVPTELKLKYINRRIQDIELLRLSLDKDDYSIAQRIGHQVKGNAVTFDFPQIAFIGFEMEKAAERKEKSKVMMLINKMETTLLATQNNIH